MEILFLMVPLGMVLVGLGVWAFFWAVGSGQFDDLDSPGWSVLGDEQDRSQAGQTSAPASEPPEPPADPTQAPRP
jgi:cbb3-type cytochrome oxidase maturation protein